MSRVWGQLGFGAACGCYHPDLKGKSLVTANIIKSLQVGRGV